MSAQVKHRRDTAANIAANTPAQGEIWVDLTNTALVVGDGVKVGGWRQSLETYTAISDSAYSAVLSDRVIAFRSLTATRSVALPSSGTYPSGARLTIVDLSGDASPTESIVAVPAPGDRIVGPAAVISSPYGSMTLLYDPPSSTWIVASGQTPMLGWSPIAASQSFSSPGRYKVTTANITLTCPTGGVGGDIVLKEASGTSAPNITLAGVFDGQAGLLISKPSASFTLAWDPTGGTYLVI